VASTFSLYVNKKVQFPLGKLLSLRPFYFCHAGNGNLEVSVFVLKAKQVFFPMALQPTLSFVPLCIEVS
jgi:hypothetical protein